MFFIYFVSTHAMTLSFFAFLFSLLTLNAFAADMYACHLSVVDQVIILIENIFKYLCRKIYQNFGQ